MTDTEHEHVWSWATMTCGCGAELEDVDGRMVVHAPWADAPSPLDDEIAAQHPLRTGNHARYQRAIEMISPRHSKYALVDLVNWLLSRVERKDGQI